MDITSRMSHYFHRFSQNLPLYSRIRCAADSYALELLRELVSRLFSPSYFRGAVSLGVKSVVPFAGYIEILRVSRWIKPRLSRDDPTKWSHGGHESISFWKNVAGTNQISYPVLSRYFETLKFITRLFHRDQKRKIK